MKNFFIYLLICLLAQSVFSQTNPVRNLQWYHYYESTSYDNIFQLLWEEPEQPHDELIGYNIYRDDELYRFQTETWLGFNPEFESNDDGSFVFFNDGGPFTIYVAAVYEGGIESEYESAYCEGALLGINEIQSGKLKLYPNPVQNTIHFGEKVFKISIFDLNGKLIKFLSEAESIDLTQLSKGNYVIRYKNEKGEIFEDRFLKK